MSARPRSARCWRTGSGLQHPYRRAAARSATTAEQAQFAMRRWSKSAGAIRHFDQIWRPRARAQQRYQMHHGAPRRDRRCPLPSRFRALVSIDASLDRDAAHGRMTSGHQRKRGPPCRRCDERVSIRRAPWWEPPKLSSSCARILPRQLERLASAVTPRAACSGT